MYCCCLQLREVLCWLPMSYLLRFMFIFLITKGLVHLDLVCNIHQPELQRGMTFESKAFLFSNDEAGEKYGDGHGETRNSRKYRNFLAGQFPILFCLFHAVFINDSLRSSQNFENLSIVKNIRVPSYRFLHYT